MIDRCDRLKKESDPKVAEALSRYLPDGARVLAFGSKLDDLIPLAPKNCQFTRFVINPNELDSRPLLTQLEKIGTTVSADRIMVCEIPQGEKAKTGLFKWLASTGKKSIIGLSAADDSKAVTDLIALAGESDLTVTKTDSHSANCTVLCCFPESKRAGTRSQKRKRVLVLSFNNVPNFGDRLGYHLLSEMIPSKADVTFAHFNPWNVPDCHFDLLIIGIGNSMFKPLLKDRLFDLVDRIPTTIGIFGTQYREALPEKPMARLLGKLKTWYARHETDTILYGTHCRNVVHLGDWLITAFPVTEAEDEEALILGEEIRQDLPLDRTIQRIQRYKTVHSPRVHPLLCALTSANTVCYHEEREYDNDNVSGKFRSMLLDIFHHDFPEGVEWTVDKHAVYRYRTYVQRQKLRLQAEIEEILE